MTKFKNNSTLKASLNNMPKVEQIRESHNVPNYDAKNRQGFDAYKVEDELRLIAMLNTLKLEPQYYRSESATMVELRDLIEKIALKDPYFVAQCIVYSRCVGEGMRSINHLAAALLAPFIAGQPYAKRFYGPWNKKDQKGGCIFRPDDMAEIKNVFATLNKSALTNSMKKGFASVIENLDSYQLFKYKKAIIDISNLVHPDVKKSKATVEVDGKTYNSIDALMKGLSVSAETWEVAQSEAGQVVAEAVKEGKLSEDKAKEVLAEAKNNNWLDLLNEGKLGILAAVRNLNNMLQSPNPDVVNKVCELISNGEIIRKGRVMPYQLDLAHEVIKATYHDSYSRQVLNALEKGFELAVPNLGELLTGRNLVIVDCSGSMHVTIRPTSKTRATSSCMDKAALIAAMIAKSTNADIIRFGNRASFMTYNPNDSVFSLSRQIAKDNMCSTNLASAFDLITSQKKVYDRIFILSDNECNVGGNSRAYKNYIRSVCSPYIYSIDMAAYGTKPISNPDKVNYYFGFSYAMFDDLASKEFNPKLHLDKVRKIEI